jgi:uncharacterized RDD family membrane protein YckC
MTDWRQAYAGPAERLRPSLLALAIAALGVGLVALLYAIRLAM